MNRMMIIPLIIGMLCLTISMLGGLPGTVDYSGTDIPSDGIIVDGQQSEIDLPAHGKQPFTFESPEGVVAILIIAIAIGIVGGISVLGSGISMLSQSLIFQSTVWLGLWAILSLASLPMINEVPAVGYLLWLCLTICFTIGVVEEVRT